MTDIHQIRTAELARLRAVQAKPSQTDAQTAPVAPAGGSERNRADILAKIDAIEAQMRAQWAAPDPANPLTP
jgi:hypothetical protein